MNKPILIYLPGIDGTGKLLYRQTDLLEKYQVLCESYPQDRPQTYEELAAAAADRLEAATAGKPCIVLAESFGGAVALTLALQRPELVERMVLVNTFAYFPKRWLIRFLAWLSHVFPNRPSPPATRPIRGMFFFSKDIPPDERKEWWNQTSGVPAKAFSYRLQLIANLDLRPQLKEITIPTLIIAACDDHVVPPRAGCEIARLLPNSRLLQPNAGHAAMVHPDINICRLLEDDQYWKIADPDSSE